MARFSFANVEENESYSVFFYQSPLVATLCHPGTINVLMLEVLFTGQGEKTIYVLGLKNLRSYYENTVTCDFFLLNVLKTKPG